MNTSDFLTIASAIVPNRPAVTFHGIEFTYEELAHRVNRLANALSAMGVTAGDRVATMQVNTNQSVEIYFAAAQLDAVYVPVNFRARSEELKTMLSIAQPSCLMIGERYLPLVEDLPEGILLGPGQVIVMDGQPSDGRPAYEALLSEADPEQMHFPEAADDDTTVVMFTAGTTGIPKGVMLTHDSFASFILSTVDPADPDVEETNLITVPFYHIAGLQAALAAVYGGRTLLVMRQFEAEEWMEQVQRFGANRAMLVPTMEPRPAVN